MQWLAVVPQYKFFVIGTGRGLETVAGLGDCQRLQYVRRGNLVSARCPLEELKL